MSEVVNAALLAAAQQTTKCRKTQSRFYLSFRKPSP
jgi:hypothetical protein